MARNFVVCSLGAGSYFIDLPARLDLTPDLNTSKALPAAVLEKYSSEYTLIDWTTRLQMHIEANRENAEYHNATVYPPTSKEYAAVIVEEVLTPILCLPVARSLSPP